jgi:hypothetical protein
MAAAAAHGPSRVDTAAALVRALAGAGWILGHPVENNASGLRSGVASTECPQANAPTKSQDVPLHGRSGGMGAPQRRRTDASIVGDPSPAWLSNAPRNA